MIDATDYSGEKKCIMVGLQLDRRGDDLIKWALTRVAEGGDRVIAVHVSRNSLLSNASKKSLVEDLDKFLSTYQELCNLHQVVLVGRVSRGASVRRTLVKEAENCGAAAVVIGMKKNFSFGSVAKYCAKNLRATTALVAVQNGKVVFEKESTKPPAGKEPKQSIRSVLHPSVGMDTTAIIPNESRPSVVLEPVKLGWPLLRQAIRASAEPLKESGNVSVVEWVMKFPDRSPSMISYVSNNIIQDIEIVLRKNTSSCKWFRYEELSTSIDHFSSEKLIGKGGSGQVYKGSLVNGDEVAIKLSRLSKEFVTEVDIVTTLQHERISPLVGISVENEDLLSVYNYFSRGSLEENLHGKRALSWDTRFKIAVGIAEGLNYLHCEISRPVIHRDIKSSNILLTEEFEAKISDFGLAVWAPTDSSFETQNDVVGTFGYLAPEYFMYGKISTKIDVYAYGVVLLELLTGRKPISDESPKDQQSLVTWATRMLEKCDPIGILDSDLDEMCNEDQIRKVFLIATLCIRRSARLRPHMSQVLRLLKGEDVLDTWVNLVEQDYQDDEAYQLSSVGSHLGLALLDVEEDDASTISFEQNHVFSLDEYLQERWSRSPSFQT